MPQMKEPTAVSHNENLRAAPRDHGHWPPATQIFVAFEAATGENRGVRCLNP